MNIQKSLSENVKMWKNTKNEILRLRKEEGDESGVTSR